MWIGLLLCFHSWLHHGLLCAFTHNEKLSRYQHISEWPQACVRLFAFSSLHSWSGLLSLTTQQADQLVIGQNTAKNQILVLGWSIGGYLVKIGLLNTSGSDFFRTTQHFFYNEVNHKGWTEKRDVTSILNIFLLVLYYQVMYLYFNKCLKYLWQH